MLELSTKNKIITTNRKTLKVLKEIIQWEEEMDLLKSSNLLNTLKDNRKEFVIKKWGESHAKLRSYTGFTLQILPDEVEFYSESELYQKLKKFRNSEIRDLQDMFEDTGDEEDENGDTLQDRLSEWVQSDMEELFDSDYDKFDKEVFATVDYSVPSELAEKMLIKLRKDYDYIV